MGTLTVTPRDEKSRFRITASAAEPIANPVVFPWEAYVEDDDVVVFIGPSASAKPLPTDFYLREIRDVNLDDCDALLDFVRTFGRIGWPVEVPLLLSPTRGKGSGLDGTTLSEIRGHIAALRWATDIWISAQNRDLDDPEQATTLIEIVNAGIRAFAPFVFSPELGDGGESTSAYAAACLQLYNDIVQRAQVRRCENASCRRLFVRQRGRSAYEQYRLHGVKYCSYLCARAKAQRDYRRRNERGK